LPIVVPHGTATLDNKQTAGRLLQLTTGAGEARRYHLVAKKEGSLQSDPTPPMPTEERHSFPWTQETVKARTTSGSTRF